MYLSFNAAVDALRGGSRYLPVPPPSELLIPLTERQAADLLDARARLMSGMARGLLSAEEVRDLLGIHPAARPRRAQDGGRWDCAFCGASRADTAESCPGCGAPRMLRR